MSERSAYEVAQLFILSGVLVAVAYTGQGASAGALVPTSSSTFRHSSTVVYVQDSSGPRWPVGRVVADWNRRTDVSLRYGRCRSGSPCIRVSDVQEPLKGRGAAAYATTTRQQRASSRGSKPASRATVKLNNTPALSAERRRALVCREIGHALGLPYTSGTGSCMSRDAEAPPRPSRDDIRRMNQRY